MAHFRLTVWLVVAAGLVLLPGSEVWAVDIWRGEPLGPVEKNKSASTFAPSQHPRSAAYAEGGLLSYDSGPAVYFPQAAVAGSFWAVRFAPLQSCSLTAIGIYSAGSPGQVRIHILADSLGFPGTDLTNPFSAELSGDLTDQIIYLPAPVDVGSGNFYVAIELVAGGAPYVAGDGDGGSGHSIYLTPGGSWGSLAATDFVIRAQVAYYGPDLIPPSVAFNPPDAAFADEGLPVSAQLSDLSGISEAAVHYSANGAAWSAIPLSASGRDYSAVIPTPAAGSKLRYFIEAKDGAAAPNVTLTPRTGSQNPFEVPVYPGRQIKYDDGSAEEFFVAGYASGDNRFAVRLTPLVYPAQIYSLRVFVNDTTGFFLSLLADSNGLPGRLLSGPWKVSLGAPGNGWAECTLPEGSRPVVKEGSLFAVVQWRTDSPETPGVGADGNLPDGRSFFYAGSAGWKSWVYDDWMVRAAYVTALAANRPLGFSLEQNVPNPFNPSTEIRFRLEQPGKVDLAVFNVLGQKVKTLLSGSFSGGEHSVTWDGRDERGTALSSGVYFYRLRTENSVVTRKMVLLK